MSDLNGIQSASLKQAANRVTTTKTQASIETSSMENASALKGADASVDLKQIETEMEQAKNAFNVAMDLAMDIRQQIENAYRHLSPPIE